ncbi:septum site-determining protein MinC [Comamonas faecalis]|uniref:Probable septum site-determining protein MinC n=1 Tax=Comamonas faecalis TaxID=1387849 RepID=A0ABP7QMW2_9BURK
MPVESAGQARASFDLKSAQLPVVAVALKSTDVQEIAQELAQRLGGEADFFDNDPVLIDLGLVHDAPGPIDFPALIAALRSYRTRPVAVRGGNGAQMQAAHEAGLIAAPDAPQGRTAPAQPVVREVIHEVEVVREVAVGTPTLVVDKPLRSGQQVYARGGDLIVLAMVSFGAEVIADGNIHVYAPLRGRAMAGARGNADARIFATCLEAQLVSIAGMYRTSENALPDNVRGKPAQVRLEGEKLVIEPL